MVMVPSLLRGRSEGRKRTGGFRTVFSDEYSRRTPTAASCRSSEAMVGSPEGEQRARDELNGFAFVAITVAVAIVGPTDQRREPIGGGRRIAAAIPCGPRSVVEIKLCRAVCRCIWVIRGLSSIAR